MILLKIIFNKALTKYFAQMSVRMENWKARQLNYIKIY